MTVVQFREELQELVKKYNLDYFVMSYALNGQTHNEVSSEVNTAGKMVNIYAALGLIQHNIINALQQIATAPAPEAPNANA